MFDLMPYSQPVSARTLSTCMHLSPPTNKKRVFVFIAMVKMLYHQVKDSSTNDHRNYAHVNSLNESLNNKVPGPAYTICMLVFVHLYQKSKCNLLNAL